MSILLLTSTVGSPGVTTLAVGLALTWPRSVLLVDGDPGAHQAVLAGFLGGRSAQGKGLLRVAEAHRDRRPLREAVIDQTMPLTEGAERRMFLPGFTRPGSAQHFAGVWDELAETFDRFDDLEIDVIVDAGRLGPRGLPSALAERAGLTAVVLRSTLRAVMSARVHLPVLSDQASVISGRGPEQVGVILVGEGQPYGRSEISKALGVRALATVADDPGSAAHLSDGRPRPRRFDSSALVRSLRVTSASLTEELQRSSELVRGGS